MSNRVDFFQPENNALAIPAANIVVFVDGVVFPDLEVLEIVRSGWPNFSYARLSYNPAASREMAECNFFAGYKITIGQYYNTLSPNSVIDTLPVFTGAIEKIESDFSNKKQSVEITARDCSAVLERKTLYGRRVADDGNTTKFFSGLDLIFNEDAQPNASAARTYSNGKAFRAFAGDSSSALFFSYAEVIDYLLKEYVLNAELSIPPLNLLESLTDNQIAAELDLTGFNLLKALQYCCERTGLSFKFTPIVCPTGHTQAIEFYKISTGRKAELNLQQPGQKLNISKTNIASFSISKNFQPVTHRYIGFGDNKVFEASFDLVKAWDPSLESYDYDTFSPSTNSEFYKVKDVYRKWTLNEAGNYSNAPYNQGPAFDFSKIFGTSDYLKKKRRFHPMLTTDTQSRSLGYYLQVSYDGENWWQYFDAFDVLLDECGIWLSSDRFDVDTWIAALKKVLKFRITTTVVSDERLSCEIADGPIASAAPVIDHIIQLPRPFRYRKVTNKSIFYNSSDASLGKPDEADDFNSLYEYVRKRAGAKSEIIETVDLQTPYLALHYSVDDNITTPSQSRDILSLSSDNRSTCRIKKVRMDFKNQCTELKIVRQRITNL
ncbi:MAG: hypothetical protein JW804_08680 [Sedimentisphaerales bacterium]|nr:hypothetical protein [Sedimentisphaerales bacterium]